MAVKTTMDLIPTKSKYKLPKGFSYPVGAKEISEGLKESPQYFQFEISFNDRDTFWASKFKEHIKNKEVIKIIEVEYSRLHTNICSSKKMIEDGHYDPCWVIRVYALPSEYRHSANTKIKKAVFSDLLSWLGEIGITDEYDVHRRGYGFDLSSGVIKKMK